MGCDNDVYAKHVCRGHGPRCSHVGWDNDIFTKNVCRGHGPRCSHLGCDNDVFTKNVCAATWDATKIPILEESAECMTKQINSYVFV